MQMKGKVGVEFAIEGIFYPGVDAHIIHLVRRRRGRPTAGMG